MSTFSVALGKKLVRGIEWPTSVRKIWTIHDSDFQSAPIAEPAEDRLRERAAALAGDQHVGARRPFGIGQHAVLLDDERAPERHHHQHAHDAAGERQHQDLEVAEEGRARTAPGRSAPGW